MEFSYGSDRNADLREHNIIIFKWKLKKMEKHACKCVREGKKKKKGGK